MITLTGLRQEEIRPAADNTMNLGTSVHQPVCYSFSFCTAHRSLLHKTQLGLVGSILVAIPLHESSLGLVEPCPRPTLT